MADDDRYVVLLRGINVGGRNRVPMAELRTELTAAGFDDVRTYIQSGNVILDGGGREEAEVVTAVEAVMVDRFELTIQVVARAASAWPSILAANPFPQAAEHPKFVHASLCDVAPSAEAVEAFDRAAIAPDEMQAVGRELYLWYPDGSARSKLTGALLERRLAVTTTARNWSTMQKLADLLDAG